MIDLLEGARFSLFLIEMQIRAISIGLKQHFVFESDKSLICDMIGLLKRKEENVIIENDRVVSIQYVLKNDQGQVLDSSEGGDPLVYLHGHKNIIPGLEGELAGKSTGDSLKATIAPENAYGPFIDGLKQTVPKTEFEDASQLQEGMQFQVDSDQGPMILTVVEIDDETVVLDGNHPLAGVTLHFEVEITDIREASAEEIEHGHVHGPGGHHH